LKPVADGIIVPLVPDKGKTHARRLRHRHLPLVLRTV
jgi:hypothetical protein